MTAILLSLMAALAVALSHVLAKGSLRHQDFAAFLIVRTGAAAIALAVAFAAQGGVAELRAMPAGLVWLLAALGLLAPLTINLAHFAAMRRLPVNVVTPVFHSYPAVAFVLGIFLLHIDFVWVNFIGVLAVVSGTAGFCVLRAADGGSRRADARGIALVLLASVMMAVTAIVWKALRSHASPLAICLLGTASATAALALANAAKLRGLRWGTVGTNVRTAFSGMLTFGFANPVSILAMATLSPGVVYAIVSSSVLWVGVLAFFMLKEKWRPLQIAAAVLVFAGIVVLGLGKKAAHSPSPASRPRTAAAAARAVPTATARSPAFSVCGPGSRP